MKRVMGLMVTATDVDGETELSVGLSDGAEDADPCVGQISLAINGEVKCCVACWAADALGFISKALVVKKIWSVTHGTDCDGTEELMGDA